MNIFKGLLFLHGHVNPAALADFTDLPARREYGARTAAADLAPPLGNRVASQQWFGDFARGDFDATQGCVVGGCG